MSFEFSGSAAVIGTRANERLGKFRWLKEMFVREEYCVTSPKNVCVGGCHGYRRKIMRVVSPLINFSSISQYGSSAVSVFLHKVIATIFVS